MKVKRINLIVDTREQNPLTFEKYEDINVMSDTLECGDYTPVGFDMANDDYSLIIERKLSARELIGNIGKNWDRFQRELEKMSFYQNKFLVVCGPEEYYQLYKRKMTKLHPNFVRTRFHEIRLKYGVQIVHCNNRETAEEFIYQLIKSTVKLCDIYDES